MLKNQSVAGFSLSGFEDIFKTSSPNCNAGYITSIPISELFPPEFHPFLVTDDGAMERLVKSVKRYGVREPGLARPRNDGGYELLCGNRRKRACELANIPTMPVIIREMDDDNAAIAMVDSNLEQREKLLFSEKAWAYRVKLEALNHKGSKGDCLSVEVLAEQTGESKNQIFRLIRLTELILPLIDKVDSKKLSFNPAVELSYLSQKQQAEVAEAMEKYDMKPSLSQAQRLKKMKQEGKLTDVLIDDILAKEKKASKKPAENEVVYRRFFPPDYTSKQMEEVIINLLANWKRKNCSKC